MLCENWILEILEQVDYPLRQGLFLWEAKHRCHSVRNAIPSFISHPPAVCLSVTPGLTRSLFDKSSVMVQAFKVVCLLAPLSSPQLSQNDSLQMQEQMLTWFIATTVAAKQNVYPPSNSTWGKHQVWETSAGKVKICKSSKWLEEEQWKVLDNLNNRRYYSTAYNNNNSPFIHPR